MNKALTALVILLLLVSIAALVMGIKLYEKREIMVGRLKKYEEAAIKLTDRLALPQEPFIAAIDTKLSPVQLRAFDQMDVPLRQLATLADTRYEELNQTYNDLDVMTTRLNETNAFLAATVADLLDTRQKLADTRTELETKKVELAQTYAQINQLEEDKKGLQNDVEDLNNKILENEDIMSDLRDQIATLENTIARLEAERGRQGAGPLPKDLTGEVLFVNPDWNFVILSIGYDEDITPGIDMLVYRGEKLVGKVRLSDVKKSMAIAEIVQDWEQAPIKEGDYVIF